MLAGYAQVIEHVEELRVTKEPAAQGGRAPSLDPNGATPAGTLGRAGSGQPLLEAVLGHGLRHANVVETYKYATRRAEVHLPVAHVMACHTEPHLCSIGINHVHFIKKNNKLHNCVEPQHVGKWVYWQRLALSFMSALAFAKSKTYRERLLMSSTSAVCSSMWQP